jgi:hypothetical protein
MDENKSVTAVFIKKPINTFTLTTAVSGQGTVTPSPGEHTYAQGTSVNLMAVPASGWKFSAWNGDVANPASASTTTVMDEDKSVTAVFVKKPPSSGGGGGGGGGSTQYTLNLLVDGQGMITPAAGSHSYAANTVVALTAIPADGWQFDDWTGEVADPKAATTSITMNSSKSVTANFARLGETKFSLIITASGEGTVVPAPAAQSYASGSEVTLTAVPGEGWQFSGWTGEVNDPAAAITKILMTGNQSVRASFTRIEFALSIAVAGQGSASPSPVAKTYASGTEVDITALPAAGWRFSGWSGDVTDPGSPTTTVVIDEAKSLSANFVQLEYKLDIKIEGNGKVTADPEAEKYFSRAEVSLSAIPADGWKFLNWEGDVGNKLSQKTSLIMDADQSIRAIFVQSTAGGKVTLLQKTAEPNIPSGISPVYIGLAALAAAIIIATLAITLYRRRR